MRITTLASLLTLTATAGAQGALTNQDDCANAALDTVGPGFYQVDTTNATTGVEGQNEPSCNQGAGSAIEKDIWFVYTPSTTGTAFVLACGFGPTTGGKVAVYPGTGCPLDGTSIACDGQSCPAQGGGARVEFPVTFGQSYLVQVGTQIPHNFINTVIVAEQPGTPYCSPAQPNSTGDPGVIFASGSGSVSANDLSLFAGQLPPAQFGYFLASRTQGFFQPPASQGPICLAGNIGRFTQQIITGPSGFVTLDLGSFPVNPPVAVMPGDTWNFQCWYRDGATSNFTDALEIEFH